MGLSGVTDRLTRSLLILQLLVRLDNVKTNKRVSMGLTVSRKTAKNLAVRRKKWKFLTVSRKIFSPQKNGQ